tara:strand:+ start:961 stop:1602 length:642 start_codon:yes stop_codon:yes gene_type:complete
MNLINLKKTNYFRYIQIKNLNNKIIEELSLLFLFEIETFKILNSVTEPTLKKIRFQWIIEEIENEKKNLFIISKLSKLFKKEKIKQDIINILINFRDFEFDFSNIEEIIIFFKKNNQFYNKIFSSLTKNEKRPFNISFSSQLIYFFYFKKEIDEDILIKLLSFYKRNKFFSCNNVEVSFLRLFFSKISKKKNLKISKLEFIFNLIVDSIKNEI